MVTGSHHVGPISSQGSHLVVVLVQEGLIQSRAITDCEVRKEALGLFLQPVIGVGNVTGCQVIRLV